MTLCHLKHLFRTTMAANGESMGRSTSTTPNTQGEFILLNSKDAYFLVILSFCFLKNSLVLPSNHATCCSNDVKQARW